MRKISDMNTIQIDITNACIHRCSNCTRFCGHHKKNFYMDFETFKKAVDSLEDFKGCVGMIGGEPTLHPEFEKFADYIREKRVKKIILKGRNPICNMQKYILNNLTNFKGSKTGLWSSLNRQYYKYYETIQNSFWAQNLNDHDNSCKHQALLMPRKELGISDEEWIKKRDSCWIQNTWSATITPKGAFFCEVAGSLDMLFNGPGGWEITKDWWKKDIKEFEDQFHWCELCSGCLDVPQRLSNDERDDMTPLMYEKLLNIESPKALKKQVVIHTPEEYNSNKDKYHTFTGVNDYMDVAENQRFNKNNTNLSPKEIKIINELNDSVDLSNKKEFSDWIILSNGQNDKALEIKKYLESIIINPGCLYKEKNIYIFNVISRSIRDNLSKIKSLKELKKYYCKSNIIPLYDKFTFIDNIFSIRYVHDNYKTRKIIRILGIKITICE